MALFVCYKIKCRIVFNFDPDISGNKGIRTKLSNSPTVHVVCPAILYSPLAQGTGVFEGFKQECPASQALQETDPVSLA